MKTGQVLNQDLVNSVKTVNLVNRYNSVPRLRHPLSYIGEGVGGENKSDII
jgi:hypothetical protein